MGKEARKRSGTAGCDILEEDGTFMGAVALPKFDAVCSIICGKHEGVGQAGEPAGGQIGITEEAILYDHGAVACAIAFEQRSAIAFD